jgi:hypothetical protein
MHRPSFAFARRLTVVALVLTMWMPIPLNRKIDKVIVRDIRNTDSPIVRTITSAEELEAFRALWATRSRLPPNTPMQVQYKLMILSGGRGASWFYDPSRPYMGADQGANPGLSVVNRLIAAETGTPAHRGRVLI